MRRLFWWRRRRPGGSTIAQLEHELEPYTHVQYGGQRFDALGLFVQWLAERVHRHLPDHGFSIRLYSISGGSLVTFETYDHGTGCRFMREWNVGDLNKTLEQHPRGEGLKLEIARTIIALREELHV